MHKKLRILWVSNHTPFLTDFGGGQRSNLILRVLQTVAQVDVLLLPPANGLSRDSYGHTDGIMEIAAPLTRGQRWPWSLIRGISPKTVDKIAYNVGRRSVDYSSNPTAQSAFDRLDRQNQYDLFVGRHIKFSGQVGLLKRRNAIIDVDDNEIELFKLIIRDPNTSALRRFVLAQRVRTLEKLLPRLISGPRLWVVKEEDRKIRGFEAASVLPNIPFAMANSSPPQASPQSSGKPCILFVGMLSYVYNREGLSWYLQHVWPAIYREVPEVRFLIVGSRLLPADRIAWSKVPGVEIRGFVPDVAEVYHECSFSVVPVWSGGGTNIKIIESMMYGRTCIVSEPAFRGYDTHFGRADLLGVARNAEEMVELSIRLLRNPAICKEKGLKAAELVNENYSYRRFENAVLETVNSIVESLHT